MIGPQVLTDAHRDAFAKDGVVCIRGALTSNEVERLAGAIDRAVAQIGQTPTGYDITAVADAVWHDRLEPTDPTLANQYNLAALATLVRATSARRLKDPLTTSRQGRFLVDTGTWTRIGELRSVALWSALPAIAGELLFANHARFYDDQVFVKEPGTIDRTAFHQDLGYFHIEGDQGCVMWVPVDFANRDSGALGYVRGSHLWGKRYRPNIFMSALTVPSAEGEDLPDIDDNEADYDIVYFDVEPGDVVVHHFRTVHGSHGNASTTQTRRAASLRYVGENVRFRRRPGAPAQPHRPLDDWADGAELCDPWFPLVWRRDKRAVAAE